MCAALGAEDPGLAIDALGPAWLVDLVEAEERLSDRSGADSAPTQAQRVF